MSEVMLQFATSSDNSMNFIISHDMDLKEMVDEIRELILEHRGFSSPRMGTSILRDLDRKYDAKFSEDCFNPDFVFFITTANGFQNVFVTRFTNDGQEEVFEGSFDEFATANLFVGE